MADSEGKQIPAETGQVQDRDNNDQRKLKHLEFVQVAAIYAVVCFSSVYEYAKENSGPLKPGVQAVEATVKTVIGPVYERFHDVPFELLKFVDRKVDTALSDLDGRVPGVVKAAAQKAPEAARAVAAEVRRSGVVEAAKALCKKYEPAAAEYAVSTWRWLNRLPLFPEMAQLVVPTAAYWSEKYNQAVAYSAERGFPGAAYLPLVPLERIAKVFKEGQSGPTVMANGDTSSDHVVAAE